MHHKSNFNGSLDIILFPFCAYSDWIRKPLVVCWDDLYYTIFVSQQNGGICALITTVESIHVARRFSIC